MHCIGVLYFGRDASVFQFFNTFFKSICQHLVQYLKTFAKALAKGWINI